MSFLYLTQQQVYEQNLEYYSNGGPLFFYINDASSSQTEWLENGLMVDIARNVGAALFTADHRYFRYNLLTR